MVHNLTISPVWMKMNAPESTFAPRQGIDLPFPAKGDKRDNHYLTVEKGTFLIKLWTLLLSSKNESARLKNVQRESPKQSTVTRSSFLIHRNGLLSYS